jgi:uncharacterized membrane protein YadS
MVRSLGDMMLANGSAAFGIFDAAQWGGLVTGVGSTCSLPLLGVAMAAVGLKTSLGALKGVGVRPFVLGLGGAAIVGSTGLVAIKMVQIWA